MIEDFIEVDLQLLLAEHRELREWDQPNLAAPYWRLYYDDRPGAAINIMGTEVPLEPHLLYLVPPDTPYSAHLDQPVEQFRLHFLTDAEHALAQPTAYAFPAADELLEHVEESRLLTEQELDGAVLTARLQALAWAALSRVPEERFHLEYDDERVQQAVEYMDEHFGRSLTDHEMALQANMNTNEFVDLFRNTTGMEPLEYYMQHRVKTACLLLHCTEMTIDQIAAETGFSDRHHLAKEFEQRRGLTPEAFRGIKTPDGGQ
jgi:AraC-like DNA-binding protein